MTSALEKLVATRAGSNKRESRKGGTNLGQQAADFRRIISLIHDRFPYGLRRYFRPLPSERSGRAICQCLQGSTTEWCDRLRRLPTHIAIDRGILLPKPMMPSLLHTGVEDACLDRASLLHLDEDAIRASRGKAIGKRNCRRDRGCAHIHLIRVSHVIHPTDC